MTQGDQSTNEMQAQLIERATRDPSFRKELMADPRGVIRREFGVDVPDSVDIQVVEDSPTTSYLVLPAAEATAGQQLSDDELEAVAGGWSAPGDAGCPGRADVFKTTAVGPGGPVNCC